MGWNRPLKAVSTWGDSLYQAYRTVIENTFKCKVYDTYGCAEGFQVAAQCEYGNYHIHALDVIVEYLDDLHQPVMEGEVGNLVITRLHPGPMPLIRYQVGDLGVSAASQTCACGRELPLMKSVQGRDADVVLTPSGNRLIVHYFTGILEHFTEIDSFQIEQDNLDHILVRILPNKEISSVMIDRIIQALKEKGANDLKIELKLVESIQLSPTGKHKFVINTMKK
ncbi:MAG: phenylacetate--CoA ligase family protein [Bacteroidales bacterium]|nr:phenylacetate--CoA ligase family protein [Bacteroidales bacterium]